MPSCILFLAENFPNTPHLLIIDLNNILSLIQTQHQLEITRIVDLLDAKIMQKVILFLLLVELDMKFCVLLFFLHDDQFSDHIAEDLLIGNCIFAVFYDLIEHVFEADHEEWVLLEGEAKGLEHYYDEVLDFATLVGELLEFVLDGG